eukprot:1159599-Pelagomonas_calceolata.AAC.5
MHMLSWLASTVLLQPYPECPLWRCCPQACCGWLQPGSKKKFSKWPQDLCHLSLDAHDVADSSLAARRLRFPRRPPKSRCSTKTVSEEVSVLKDARNPKCTALHLHQVVNVKKRLLDPHVVVFE